MPSKKSKSLPHRSLPWRDEPSCSEPGIRTLAQLLAAELRSGDRVLLEGPMGAGKTTFARALLEALGVVQPPEGSPSFAIAHEYQSRKGEVVHIDFYRLRDESEIDDAGIPAYFWERDLLVVCEWLSLFPGFEKSVLATKEGAGGHAVRNWRVTLAIVNEERRSVRIENQD